jgi:predicted GIY-YIG superfamily endonuclease
MAWVYMLKGTTGRFYIGATKDLQTRVARHNTGTVHSTKRLGLPLELVASREFDTIGEAYAMEKKLKSWKNPSKALAFLRG